MTDQLRVVAHGGGVQTTAMLVLCATGRLPYRTFLFANTGDDSEDPDTLRYLHEIAVPYAAEHGITIHVLDRVRRDGSVETLYGRLTREGTRTIDIPVRMSGGTAAGAPGHRNCTKDFKLIVVGRWLKAHGATEETPAEVAVGISLDEIERATNRRSQPFEEIVYPLLDMRLRRHDCVSIIRAEGLPVPPKSACWFCPMQRPSQWQEKRRSRPELFARACDLEAQLVARRAGLGRDPAYLTRFGVPLAGAVPPGQDGLPFDDLDDPHCDNGWCMT